MTKPYSVACEKNSDAILNELTRLLIKTKTVLEIGSGTGQHAVYFASHLKHLIWQASDIADNHQGINCWLDEAQLTNLLAPITVDVTQDSLINNSYDAIFMANTLHIMSWLAVQKCIKRASLCLNAKGLLIVYGPFNYRGEFTSASNQQFDLHLKSSNAERGIRDFEKVNRLANDAGFFLKEDNTMPSNNRLLVWQLNG
jgi:cyclopropane fatty-acyl-phospholipid synthase-like methyltransferase